MELTVIQTGGMVVIIFVRGQATFTFHMARAAGWPCMFFLGACYPLGIKADSKGLMGNDTVE